MGGDQIQINHKSDHPSKEPDYWEFTIEIQIISIVLLLSEHGPELSGLERRPADIARPY